MSLKLGVSVFTRTITWTKKRWRGLFSMSEVQSLQLAATLPQKSDENYIQTKTDKMVLSGRIFPPQHSLIDL